MLCDLAHGYPLPTGLSDEAWKAAQDMRVVD